MTQKELAIKLWRENTKTSKRNNPVGIRWYILDNSQLLDLGIAPNKFENWSDMFRQDDDNSIKESYYLNDISRMFFGNPNTNVFSNQTEENQRTLKTLVKTIQGKMDPDADTIIYTPVGNKIHTIVKDMLENDGSTMLHKHIQDSKFYYFFEKLKSKCQIYNVQLRFADKYFASSKKCCICGHKKKNLKLSDRTYHCSECGHIVDRDVNASINLVDLNKYTIFND